MVQLKLQKRLAADILKCGQNRVWIDPTEINDVSQASSRQAVRSLIKDRAIVKKQINGVSRFRVRQRAEAKAKGRHTGFGKRSGTREARMPTKCLWVRRTRVLRRLLATYRDDGKIDCHLHKELYLKAKGNVFKNKRVLVEHIQTERTERERARQLQEQQQARREAAAAARARKLQRLEARRIAYAAGKL
ncbi:Ribosomal protein L19/L19e [Carpediemonas membranifera]|uniref:Ribosomal protein L19 n=1 Tax=Carpediemonas membranifera TaxID=201153 RepID=A0A8J6DYT3_9EUKA|nr:Ribosomal protein L19/L19e [Carpediemonas membranifera]|eukprot:KAG9392709.1 Ribosomal protein L19/L19e [Carpediemonas membranifera]